MDAPRRTLQPRWSSLAALLVFVSPAFAQRPAATPLPVTQYRARLQAAERALRPDAPRAGAAPALQPLAQTGDVRRRDGDTIPAGREEWSRRLRSWSTPPTREQMNAAHAAVRARLRALDNWTKSDFTPADARGADAQNIVRQLEATGQIQTGPTGWQRMWARVMKWWRDLVNSLARGGSSVMPTGTATGAYYILIGLGVLCLALIAWLLARMLLSLRGRAQAKPRVEAVGPDADLLHFGPDELRARARRLAASGDFREALRHLYVALLLELDARGVWRYDPRRTNGELLAQLRASNFSRELAAPMADLTRRFERVRYGNAPCDEADWNRFSSDADRLTAQLAATGGAS